MNRTKQLFDLADNEARKLQVKQGRPFAEGIRSTQVQAVITALGTILDDMDRHYKNLLHPMILMKNGDIKIDEKR